MADVSGAECPVGGKEAQGAGFTGHLEERMPWVVGFVLLLTFVTMVWPAESARQPSRRHGQDRRPFDAASAAARSTVQTSTTCLPCEYEHTL
jgi:hypothetical protein